MFRLSALILFVFPLLLVACAPTPPPAALIINTLVPTHTPTQTPTQTPTLPPDLPAPRLLHRQPSYSQIKDLQPVITLKFDREMNAESVARALTVDPVLPISVTAFGGVTLTVDLLAPLMPGGSYTFTLGTGATDRQGVRLDEEFIWNYSPKPLAAILTGPIARLAPRPFKIYFTYPVDPASLERALWITPALSGTLGWNDDYTVASFTPEVRYEADTLYVIRFDRAPLLGPTEHPLPTPAPVSFVSAPAIVLHSPASDRVVANTTIRIEFEQPMDPASVEAAFHLSPAISGTFSWNENTLVFVPDGGYFDESTSYSVRLDPSLRSAQGETVLRADYGWSFRTAAVNEVLASFGHGSNMQVLNADGQRAVQFEVYQTRAPLITFTLYALTQRQFMTNFALGSEVSYWDEHPLTNTASLAPIAQWSEATAQAIEVDYYGYTLQLHETHIPAEVPPGFYLLEIGNWRINDQLFIVLTQHSLVVKQTSNELVAWVTDLAGQPQADVLVEAMARGGWSVGECRTDAQGLCCLTPNPLNPPMLVLAHTPGGVTLAGLNHEWSQGGGAPSSHYAVSVYTDQPLYHYGETVNFKAVVRQEADAALSVPPAGTVVTVNFKSAWGEVLRTFYLTTDEFGAVHSRLHLDPEMRPDEYEPPVYSIEVSLGGQRFSESILVAKGLVAGHRVSLTTDAATYVIGDLMTISGHVQDQAGQPVAGARVSLAQYEPDYYGGHCWFPTCWTERDDTRLTGRTDQAGNVTFYVLAEQLYSGETLVLELTTLAEGVSGSGLALVEVQENDATLLLGLPSGKIYAPGQTFEVALSSRTRGDAPLPHAPLQLTLNGWDTLSANYTAVLQSLELTTDSEGRATLPLTVAEPGHYQLRLTGHDSRGNVIDAVHEVYIFAEGTPWPSPNPLSTLSLVADRYQYAPGEAAVVWIESAVSGPALLTVERGTVRRAELITLTAPLTRITLPLEAQDAPNVHVTVQVWQAVSEADRTYGQVSLADAYLYTADLNLPVLVTNKQLTLTLTPDRAEYVPGAAATVHIRATDANGAPVTAQLSLALTDERAFALYPKASAALFSAFYYQRSARAALYHSQQPRRTLFGDEGGGCGGDGSYSDMLSATFQAGAFWEPALVTDANGELTLTLNLPATLADWRLTVVAVTADTQVGEALIVLDGQP